MRLFNIYAKNVNMVLFGGVRLIISLLFATGEDSLLHQSKKYQGFQAVQYSPHYKPNKIELISVSRPISNLCNFKCSL